YGHVQHAYSDRSFTVAAGLFVAHENVPDAGGIEIVAGIVEQRLSLRGLQARDEAIPQEATRRIAPVGIKTESNDGLAVANDVGDEGQDTDGHLAEINKRVANRRFDRDHRFADVNNPHEFTCRWRRYGLMKVATAAAVRECRKRYRDRRSS